MNIMIISVNRRNNPADLAASMNFLLEYIPAVLSYYRQKTLPVVGQGDRRVNMTVNISGVSNRRMKTSLKNALLSLEGVQAVDIDRTPGTMEIEFEPPEEFS